MAGYIIAEIDVTDPDRYREYAAVVSATVEQYGGTYEVVSDAAETLEGDWSPKRIVIVRFDNVERAREWWSSEAYRVPKSIRQSAAVTQMILAEGYR
jgi:uncharacterized protein (DUF1330 family)